MNMKTTEIPYVRTRELLLQGYPMKLPTWEGYWKFNPELGKIQVHLKNGKIINTPNALYTLHDNWEIATTENCPILKKEIDKEKEVKDIEILEVDIISFLGRPVPVIMVKHNDKITNMSFEGLSKLVGNSQKAHKMITEHMIGELPKEVREEAQAFTSELESILESVARDIFNKEMSFR